MKKTPKQENNK